MSNVRPAAKTERDELTAMDSQSMFHVGGDSGPWISHGDGEDQTDVDRGKKEGKRGNRGGRWTSTNAAKPQPAKNSKSQSMDVKRLLSCCVSLGSLRARAFID